MSNIVQILKEAGVGNTKQKVEFTLDEYKKLQDDIIAAEMKKTSDIKMLQAENDILRKRLQQKDHELMESRLERDAFKNQLESAKNNVIVFIEESMIKLMTAAKSKFVETADERSVDENSFESDFFTASNSTTYESARSDSKRTSSSITTQRLVKLATAADNEFNMEMRMLKENNKTSFISQGMEFKRATAGSDGKHWLATCYKSVVGRACMAIVGVRHLGTDKFIGTLIVPHKCNGKK